MVLKGERTIPRPKQPIHLSILEKYEYYAKEYPELKAFINSSNHDDCLDFATARKHILSVATFWNRNGLKKGEVVGLVLPNCWQFPVTLIGSWTAGLVTSAASAAFTHYELTHQFNDSGAVVIVTEDNLLPNVLKAIENCPKVRKVICIRTSTNPLPSSVISYSDVLSTPPTFDYKSISFDMEEDLLMLPYSSGTTGAPKGVMISHLNMAFSLDIFIDNEVEKWKAYGMDLDLLIGRSSLALLPQYHAMGLFIMLATSYMGVQQVMFRKFSLKSMLKHVEEFEISVLVLVPSIVALMAESPHLDKYDLSSLIGVTCGAAPLSQSVVEKLKTKIPIDVKQGYGMTELTIASHFSRADQPDKSVGKLIANLEMKVLDPETGRECGPNEQGELFIRGPVVMKGYKNKPEETRKNFDSDGFLRTGDLVYYDEDGFMFVCERTKELIKVKGSQVPPAELENVLHGLEEVVDCAVIGVPDAAKGEVPRAYIVRKDGLTEEKVHAFVNEHVAPYKRLSGGVVFVDVIPRTATGKILRRKLKEEYLKENKSKL